jgi:hypothetical protein
MEVAKNDAVGATIHFTGFEQTTHRGEKSSAKASLHSLRLGAFAPWRLGASALLAIAPSPRGE